MVNLMPCWLVVVFQGRRAVFDLGGGRENHSVPAGGCSVANLLAVCGEKKKICILFFFFSPDFSMNYGTSYFKKSQVENLTPWRVVCRSEP